jgi:hypothetical protein
MERRGPRDVACSLSELLRVTLLQAMLNEESRVENRSGTLFRTGVRQACTAPHEFATMLDGHE